MLAFTSKPGAGPRVHPWLATRLSKSLPVDRKWLCSNANDCVSRWLVKSETVIGWHLAERFGPINT